MNQQRLRKRNLRSYYYDTETNIIDTASKMPTYPAVRKRRYKFLGQFSRFVSSNRLKVILKQEYNIKVKIDDLPF